MDGTSSGLLISNSDSENSSCDEAENGSSSDECEVDDNDCQIVDYSVSDYDENDTEDVASFLITPKLSSIRGYEPDPQNDKPQVKKMKLNNTLSIRPDFKSIQKHWCEDKDLKSEDISLITLPFKVCTIKNFVESNSVLDKARDEMRNVKWNKRRLDLYEFWQTDDLVNTEQETLKQIYNFLKTEVMPWVSKCTGIPLNKCSVSCSAYTHGDYLLVHDDLDSDRCVAYILYLTGLDGKEDIWKTEYGGALELFGMDQNKQPLNVPSHKLYPTHNQLTFFQVRNNSYHQVGEVTTMDHTRLSINGWFHSDLPLDDPPLLKAPNFGLFGTTVEPPNPIKVPLDDIISPMYLIPKYAKSINKQIEENSEISLQQFFDSGFYCEISKELQNLDSWKVVGPPNRRNYEICETFTGKLEEFVNIFKSISMFELLKKYTDLELVPKKGCRPSMRMELQRWTPGSYSLMSEISWFSESELDLIIYFNVSEKTEGTSVPGQIMYVARGENDQEALMTILPENNTLNIVYRDEETCRITPFISHRAQNSKFYILVCSYKE